MYLTEGFVEGRIRVQFARVCSLWGLYILLLCCHSRCRSCRGRSPQLSTCSLCWTARGRPAAGAALCSCPGIASALFPAEQRPLSCSLRGTS